MVTATAGQGSNCERENRAVKVEKATSHLARQSHLHSLQGTIIELLGLAVNMGLGVSSERALHVSAPP